MTNDELVDVVETTRSTLGLDDTGESTELTDSEMPRQRTRALLVLMRQGSAGVILVGLIVLFSLWIPNSFDNISTIRVLATDGVVVGLIAVGLLFPVAAGFFDLSIGQITGLSAIISSTLMANHGVNVVLAIAISLAIACVVGLINAFFIVHLKIDSLVTTLAVGSILGGVIVAVSGNKQVVGLPNSFDDLGQKQAFGIPLPVIYGAAIAAGVWYLLQHTVRGRHLYATGGNREAARLTGIRISRLTYFAFVMSALFSAIAGVVVTARIGAGSPAIGPPYLLPAYAAVFLGATQVRSGRPNIGGTLLGVYVLAIGTGGLQLAGAASWSEDVFSGAVLLFAVALSASAGNSLLPSFLRRRRRNRSAP